MMAFLSLVAIPDINVSVVEHLKVKFVTLFADGMRRRRHQSYIHVISAAQQDSCVCQQTITMPKSAVAI